MVDTGGNGRRKYFPGHRQRAYRKRLQSEIAAAGVPVISSFADLRAAGTPTERNRDAQRKRTPRKRGPDMGVRLYISTADAEALARGEVTPAVVEKVAAKLKPPEPLAGQLDIITTLADRQEVTK
jgi:hypothetical protein